MSRHRPTVDDIRVLHRDGSLLVVNKPAGLATTSPDGGPSLAGLVRSLDGDAEVLHPSSRLDAEVTGVVTFARTRAAIEGLLEARRRGDYRRLYVGLSEGVPSPPAGTWREPIALHPRDPRLRAVGAEGAPRASDKAAETRYAMGPREAGLSWLWLRPVTGRTHQLRVHAAFHGAPLAGDVHYGGPRRTVLDDGRVVLHRRVALHCRAVVLLGLEGSGHVLRFLAPVPEDLCRTWSAVGGPEAPLADEAALQWFDDGGGASPPPLSEEPPPEGPPPKAAG